MFWRANWPAILWAIFILILCGVPGTRFPELSFLEWLKPDKIAHLVLFGVQSFFLIRGFELQTRYPFLTRNPVAVSLILTIAYGCLVEIMQTYIFIQRSGDIRDAIANSLGALLGWWFYKRYYKRTSKTKSIFR